MTAQEDRAQREAWGWQGTAVCSRFQRAVEQERDARLSRSRTNYSNTTVQFTASPHKSAVRSSAIFACTLLLVSYRPLDQFQKNDPYLLPTAEIALSIRSLDC